MTRPSRRQLLEWGIGFGLVSAGCGKQGDVIVESGAGKGLGGHAIDADPLALLPPNAVGAATLDARALFASRFGARLFALTQAKSPLPASAEFDPRRDLERVYVGFYSMQGADVAGVATGTFQPEKIEAAATSNPQTFGGAKLTLQEYAGRNMYLTDSLGFCVLTSRTVLFGDETGMRRALDRISEGRAQRKLPAWMVDVLERPKAPLSGGADFTSQPLSAAAREQVPFLNGVKTLAVVGNFQEPGLNLAGTLTYDEPEAALRGAENLRKMHERLANYAAILSIIGLPQPVRSLEARAEDKEVRFVAGVDGAAVAVLLEKAEAYLAQKR
ncbi:MAG TPA: hypothetical protein VFQ61_27310 [Polyangiaceae bacterium]|nr:hypothetical protein [Polyangiaceae bacterium]